MRRRRLFTLMGACALAGCSKTPAPPELAPEPPAAEASGVKLAAMRDAVAAGKGASALGHLGDPDVVVRRGAILAVGTEAAVGPESLFGSLHDPDAEVRELAASALRSRGLSATQVSLARQFAHPDPAERLALLNDLAGGAVASPGPWLAQLAADREPAVRLGAARVASELGLKAPWIAAIAARDPDPAVRNLAAYYRDSESGVAAAGHAE